MWDIDRELRMQKRSHVDGIDLLSDVEGSKPCDSSKKSSKPSQKGSKELFQGSSNQGSDGTIRVRFVQQSQKDTGKDAGKPSRNGQVDQNDDEEFEKEDLEREKEIKELVANELDDDDLFDDDSSFTSHQTSVNHLESPSESFQEFHTFPRKDDVQDYRKVVNSGPLLTARGSNFLKKVSPQKQDAQKSNFSNEAHLQSAEDSSRDARLIEGTSAERKFTEGSSTDKGFADGMEQDYSQQVSQNANQWRNPAPPHQTEYQNEFAVYGSMPNYAFHDTRDVQSNIDQYDIGHQFSSNDRVFNHENAPDSFHQHFSANRDSRERGLNENTPETYQYLSANADRNEEAMDRESLRTYQQLYGDPDSLHVDNFEYEHQHLSGHSSGATQWQQLDIEHTCDWKAERQRDQIPYNDHSDVYDDSSNNAGSPGLQQNNEQQKVPELDHNQNKLAAKENAQLKILYDARGCKIEELQKSFSGKIEEQEKEIRVLQHRLTLVTGERDGLSVSLEQSQDLIREARSEVKEAGDRLAEEQKRCEKLKNERKELIEKLGISESTIESLNQQLTSLNQADSLARMRSQHEVLMSTLRQKHEEEVLYLKEKLDDTRKELNWKTEDVNRLQDEVQFAKKLADQAKIESAETINKLSKSLEQSQRQLREILEEASMTEFGELKYQLKQTTKNKMQLEEENKGYKDEIKELTDQLRMYEAALNTASEGPSSSTPLNVPNVGPKWQQHDSLKTPLSRFAQQNNMSESPVYSLRDELVKALANNKTKRTELTNEKIKSESLERKLADAMREKQLLEIENKSLQAEALANTVSKESNDDLALTTTKPNDEIVSSLRSEIEGYDVKLQTLESQCEQLQKENQNLKSEIAEMVHEHDKDKIGAIKNYEKTFMQFNEDSKKNLEQRLKEAHNVELEELRNETKKLNNELLDVKDSYVTLSNENKTIEKQVRSECDRHTEELLKELRLKLEEEYKSEVLKLEEKMSNENFSRLENERKRLKNEFEEEAKHRIETAIALAKVEWFAAYESEKTNAIERAVENAKLKWSHEGNSDNTQIQELMEGLKHEWEQAKEDEFDTRLAIAVKLARSEWEEIAQEETETAIEHAIEECNRKNKVQNQTAIQEAVMNAKNQWDSNAKSLSDNQKCSSREVELLKREIDLCQAEIFRIKAEAEERENELKNEIEEMQVKHEEMVNDAVANAKAAWTTERDALQRQIFKEESKRIRTELLRVFAQNNQGELDNISDKLDDDEYSGYFKETLVYIKEIYEKKLREKKEAMENTLVQAKVQWNRDQHEQIQKMIADETSKIKQRICRENDSAVAEIEEKHKTEINKIRKQEEMKFQKTLEENKNDWKRELRELQTEHEVALKEIMRDIHLRADQEKENTKRNFNEYLRKVKKEYTEKLEKQKIELETYHTDLTKRTLQLARKEWELETSYRKYGSSANRGQKALSESTSNTLASNMTPGQATGLTPGQLESSDSGFTSPFSRVSRVMNTPLHQDGVKIGAVQGLVVSTSKIDQSPPFEQLLEKVEADIMTLKGERAKFKNEVTQTDLKVDENATALRDMREYYLETVNKIKEDVFKHITKTKENAASNLRKEIAKERRALLNRIRKKYLKNVKSVDTKSAYDDKTTAVLAAVTEVEAEVDLLEGTNANNQARGIQNKENTLSKTNDPNEGDKSRMRHVNDEAVSVRTDDKKAEPEQQVSRQTAKSHQQPQKLSDISEIDFEEEQSLVLTREGIFPHSNKKMFRPIEMESDKEMPKPMDVGGSKKSSRVSATLHRRISAGRESSPSNSMFSCDSNGTFYTELPSSFIATPSPGMTRVKSVYTDV